MPRKNPPNLVPTVPADPNSDPGSSYSSLSGSSDSSDDEYSKKDDVQKIIKINVRVKIFLSL